MTSSTTAALEWAAQVRAAAIKMHSTGSPVIASSSARTLGAFSAGASVSSRICRARSMRPRPIATRPKSRVGVRWSSYTLLSAVGGLYAVGLGLKVPVYDPMTHYQQVRDAWAGTRNADGR